MKKILLLGFLISLFSCEVDRLSPFCDALIAKDVTYVKHHVDDILEDLFPYPDYYDYTGHHYNLEMLVNELNKDECLFAQIRCYGCIETFPLQSEVEIEINDGGYYWVRILDIATPHDSPMYFVGMHE